MNVLNNLLTASSSIEDLNNFLSKLDDEKIGFNGKKFIHSSSGNSVEFQEVKDKIIRISKRELKGSHEKISTAEAVSAVIYKFEMISHERLSQIKNLYNDVAKEFNSLARSILTSPDFESLILSRFKRDDPRGGIHLEFLNEFLQWPLHPFPTLRQYGKKSSEENLRISSLLLTFGRLIG
jgi:hypothetical protein